MENEKPKLIKWADDRYPPVNQEFFSQENVMELIRAHLTLRSKLKVIHDFMEDAKHYRRVDAGPSSTATKILRKVCEEDTFLVNELITVTNGFTSLRFKLRLHLNAFYNKYITLPGAPKNSKRYICHDHTEDLAKKLGVQLEKDEIIQPSAS